MPSSTAIIVIDIRLGGGERGDHYAPRLRADPAYKHIPVIMMSGDIRQLRQVAAASSVGTLPKPFDIEQMYALLGDACADRQG